MRIACAMWLTAQEWAQSRFAIARRPGDSSWGDARRRADHLRCRLRPAASAAIPTFGNGAIDGVAARSANNAAAHGACADARAGIPGSASTAVLLAALILHGIRQDRG
jgi:putative tricarboxylic transport membrane protein